MKDLICSNCNLEIKESYYKCLDNFLQVKYFDSEEDNIFCSKNCFCSALFLTEFYKE